MPCEELALRLGALHAPISSCQASYESIRGAWFEHLMPTIERSQVADLLTHRPNITLYLVWHVEGLIGQECLT
jgi:hypothetical protein